MSESARRVAPVLLVAAALFSAIVLLSQLLASDPIDPPESPSTEADASSPAAEATEETESLPRLEREAAAPPENDSSPSDEPRFEQVGDRRFEVTPDGVRIEVGTPERYRKPLLTDQKLHQIFADGTQVYGEVPFEVRQPDGTLAIQTATIEIEPTDPLPVRD